MERNRVGVGRTTLHGYDGQHRKMRRYFKPIVEAGAARCSRCGQPIHPYAAWDLGHRFDRTDPRDNRGLYAGPQHRSCNRATTSHAAWRRRGSPRSSAAQRTVPRALKFFDTGR